MLNTNEMLERKCMKFIRNTNGFDENLPQLKNTPIVVSDSKGIQLDRLCASQIERTIIWKCAKGRNSSEGLEYIRRNIDYWIRQYCSIWLYVQLGTCDFTTLTRDCNRYLNLDTVSEGGISHSAVSISNFEKIVEIAHT